MKLFDLHNDILTENLNFINELNSYPKGVFCVLPIYRGEMSFKNAYNIALKYVNSNQKGKIAFEDVGYDDIDYEKLFSLKPLYVSLTYNDEGLLGYGVNQNKRLKEKGFEFIKKCNDKNVSIDLAHLSQRGMFDVLDNANRVINSHTCFWGVNQHKRNISDEIISLIIKRGGIIGLTLVSPFLNSANADIESVVRHIDYFAERFGLKNLCFGSDFNGTDLLPKGLKNYFDFTNLFERLIALGYAKSQIKDVFFNNAFNYFKNDL